MDKACLFHSLLNYGLRLGIFKQKTWNGNEHTNGTSVAVVRNLVVSCHQQWSVLEMTPLLA